MKYLHNGKPVIIVEDGTVDINKLELDGWYVIIYKQGAKEPILPQIDPTPEKTALIGFHLDDEGLDNGEDQ